MADPTPTPWDSYEQDSLFDVIRGPDNVRIATVYGGRRQDDLTTAERKANTALIKQAVNSRQELIDLMTRALAKAEAHGWDINNAEIRRALAQAGNRRFSVVRNQSA